MTGDPRRTLEAILDGPGAVAVFLADMSLGAEPRIEVLSGGVSSELIRVSSADRCVVVKRALEELRVAAVWRSRPERSLIEARCARLLDELVPGSVPRVLADLPDRLAFVMACAPDRSETWKERLLRGEVEPELAANVGTLLGRIHARSASRPGTAAEFADRSFFEELRLDAYFRHVRGAHPDLAPALDQLIAGLDGPGLCLVHGDFSPKNLLVTPDGGVLLLDHEVAHWGQPAFDAAFVVSHLMLKSVLRRDAGPAYTDAAQTLLAAYREAAGKELAEAATGPFGATVLGGLLLARIDGKSPVEYLETEPDRDLVRGIARRVLLGGAGSIDEVVALVAESVGNG